MIKPVSIALIFYLVGAQWAFAQTLAGRVTDPAGTPLAFVTVLLNDDSSQGGFTDIEGRFQFALKEAPRSLTFRYLGFQTLRVDSSFWREKNKRTLVIVLQPIDYELPEATIVAGENPANILIRKAIARRHDNNPERLNAFSCRTYNKIVFDMMPNRAVFDKWVAKKDTTREAIQKMAKRFAQAERTAQEQHAFLLESATERFFLAPNLNRDRVLLNRVSGFENTSIVALANLVQPFSFYGDYLRILDRNFVNPISPGSPDRYFFNIEDTLYVGPDTVWAISFKPRKGKVFEALQGVLHLHSDGWAVQNVRAQAAGPARFLELTIEQAYQICTSNGRRQWFPSELNFEIAVPKYPSEEMGMKAAGRSYVTTVEINPPLRPRDFDPEMPVSIDAKANVRADSVWTDWRGNATLDAKETLTYQRLDSLGKKANLDQMLKLADYVATGRFPIVKGVNVELSNFLRLNEFENVRLGLGLTNAPARPLRSPQRIEWGANFGYGFRDKQWKYGAYAVWRILRGTETHLRVGWRRDLREPGALYELQPAAFLNRTLYAERMDYANEWQAILTGRPHKTIFLQGALRRQILEPAYVYQYADGAQPLHFTEATVMLRFYAGEPPRTFFGNNLATISRWPTIEIAATRGFLALGGAHEYTRFAAAMHQTVFIRRLGRLVWRLEAGSATPTAPLAKLFTLNQAGGGFSLFLARNTFQALPDTLIAADRFANFYLSQEIGPVLYKHKYSAPFLTLLQNAAWGESRRPELQGIGFLSLPRPYFESGIRLDNLIQVNYVNVGYLGVGVGSFYRWGSLSDANWKKNVTVRLAMRMVF